MREILFRGKRVDNGEWVYGNFVMDARELLEREQKAPTTILEDGFIRRYNFSARKVEMIEIDRETVGQYTGLNDKNGQKIFEGDVVSTDLKRPYLIVEFRDGCFMFNCNDGGKSYYDIILPILDAPQEVYKYGEVIANIHDHPELLGGKDT